MTVEEECERIAALSEEEAALELAEIDRQMLALPDFVTDTQMNIVRG